tara:strand:- start:1233 stop:1628 length:396 start_codon:yes stop_codon:yes gene_type:complete
MAKAKKVEFGIEITKPWSKEMYAHNDNVQEVVVGIITKMWRDEMADVRTEWEEDMADEDFEPDFEEAQWNHLKSDLLSDIQTAVTCYGFCNYSVVDVEEIVLDELETAPYFRLNEMVEELDLKLEKGFVGF